MADYMWAEITIPKRFFDKDVRAVAHQYVDLNPLSTLPDIDSPGPFVTLEANVAYGRFETLEDYLKERRIPFDRFSAGYCEFQPETRYYRPARDGKPEVDMTVLKDNNDYPYIETFRLKPLLECDPVDAVKKLAELVEEYDPSIEPLENWV